MYLVELIENSVELIDYLAKLIDYLADLAEYSPCPSFEVIFIISVQMPNLRTQLSTLVLVSRIYLCCHTNDFFNLFIFFFFLFCLG